jgi:hypothetical protein
MKARKIGVTAQAKKSEKKLQRKRQTNRGTTIGKQRLIYTKMVSYSGMTIVCDCLYYGFMSATF